MAKIVFVWELGSGLGHIFRITPLALELKQRGHEVVFILRDLEQVEEHLGQYDFAFYQAPLWKASAVGMPPITSYVDILFRYGFFDLKGVTGLLKSWKNIFQLINSDLIIFDHSPTALLATHSMGIPRVIYGNGFEIPPQKTPLPSLRWWDKQLNKTLLAHEQKVLKLISQVLENDKEEPLPSLSQLFIADDIFLATFEELDHYPCRIEGNYYGIPLFSENTASPNWPICQEKKIFIYLDSSFYGFDSLINELKSLPCCVLVYSPGLSKAKKQSYQAGHIHFSNAPVDIRKASQECNLTICHSGAGTAIASLLAGRPLLIIPNHLEQYSIAKRITELGAGLLIEPRQKKIKFKFFLKELLHNSKYTQAAERFAKKYSAFDPDNLIQTLADRCEKLL